MTRKQRQSRTETYDLSNPRNVAAFEALIAEDDDEEQDHNRTPARGKQTPQRTKREKEKFFKLRTNTTPSATTQGASTEDAKQSLERLQEMFQGTCEASMIADVLRGTGGDFTAAVDALLAMLGSTASCAGTVIDQQILLIILTRCLFSEANAAQLVKPWAVSTFRSASPDQKPHALHRPSPMHNCLF